MTPIPTTFDVETAPPVSGCVNAPMLGIWRTGRREYRLGRKRDGMLLPGSVVGDLDRARRCWHALSVLQTYAGEIIENIEGDDRAMALLIDWGRMTDD